MSSSVKERAYLDQAETLIQGMPVTLWSNSVIATSVVVSMAPEISTPMLVFWCAVVLVINAVRGCLIVWFREPGRLSAKHQAYLRVSSLGALISGCAWAAVVPLSTDTPDANMFMVFIGAGLSAGAVVQGRSHAASVICFLMPIQIALIFDFFSQGSLLGYVFTFNIAFFLLMMCRSAKNSEASFLHSSTLKHEASALARSLQDANDRLDQSARRLQDLADHDALTGAYNRAAFHRRLALSVAIRGARPTLLLLDLDGFKPINDAFGHSVGDQVLAEIGRRLSDDTSADGVVARLGGDEFCVLFEAAMGTHEALLRAQAILEAVKVPILLSDRTVSVGASIGVAQFPEHGETANALMINADLALYAAKGAGRGTARLYDDALRESIEARRAYQADLELALAQGDIQLWFQPQVDLSTQEVIGYEGLLRWRHARYGWVPPTEIVSAAAATRQCRALTNCVIDQCCQLAARLRDVGRSDLVVSLNVSPLEFRQSPIADMIGAAIAAYSISPSQLMVEITEETMFCADDNAKDLEALSELGVPVALDDFGMGYSSFAILQRLTFGLIKVDRSFVANILADNRRLALLKAILATARELDLKVIIEGIEEAEQLAVLRRLGGRFGQGYHFGKAMPVQAVLSEYRKDDVFMADGLADEEPPLALYA